ncbi:hypothetical protein [Nonomuraea aurantiaca]|uniref:hypothetical protein n=1 Tax=Nonomuraea aurantiaca TaxID=2878562 RepID=UPI001CD9E2EF|nr:hypothetical protein [Nonomuraea aurantiaca]
MSHFLIVCSVATIFGSTASDNIGQVADLRHSYMVRGRQTGPASTTSARRADVVRRPPRRAPPDRRRPHRRALSDPDRAGRLALGAPACDDVLAEGRLMDLDEAIAYARRARTGRRAAGPA